MRFPHGRWILALALLTAGISATSLPAQAQDEQAEPIPFVYMLHGEVDPGMMGEYTQALQAVAEANRQHDNGIGWAAYMPLTGDGPPKFRYFIPLQTVGEIDGWSPMWQVMSDVHGPEKAREVLQALSGCWTPESLLLAYNSAVSNPADTPATAPPPFAYHLTVRVHPGDNFEYFGMAQNFVEAHSSHEQGMNWIGYSNMIGGRGTEIHYFMAMNKLGEMDAWPMNAQVMIESLGQEAWQTMQKRLTEITDVSSEILVMSPPHSNLEGAE
jgi:hypothetical protein